MRTTAALLFATNFRVRLQPADTSDQKETQCVGPAAPHEFPARIRKIRENQHADSHRCCDQASSYRKSKCKTVSPHRPPLLVQLRLQEGNSKEKMSGYDALFLAKKEA